MKIKMGEAVLARSVRLVYGPWHQGADWADYGDDTHEN